MSPFPGHGALPVRRSYEVESDALDGVVIEVDATEAPNALAVLQASLHEVPEGTRLVYGYDLTTSGLGAWIGDHRARLRVWPALLHEDGEISADDPDDPDADILVIDFDPVADGEALDALARSGRLFIAGPESGPVPLVLDIDVELVADVRAALADPPG